MFINNIARDGLYDDFDVLIALQYYRNKVTGR